jgi:hypothetical protein
MLLTPRKHATRPIPAHERSDVLSIHAACSRLVERVVVLKVNTMLV